MKKIKILIADDHKLFREGLRLLLDSCENISVVSEASDGIECINKVEVFNPNILLLDIEMPRLDGISALKHIKEKSPNQKIIILTGHKEIDYLYKAYNLGVDGYVLKDSPSTSLVKAINIAMTDGKYIEPILIPLLKDKLDKADVREQNTSLLTRRELQILKLVAQGLYNKEIADQLGVTDKTVKNHITSLFKKINVTDRTQAAVYAIKNGYVNMI